jgi:hypothetical protein
LLIYSKTIISIDRCEVHFCQQYCSRQKRQSKKSDPQFRLALQRSCDPDEHRARDGGEFAEKIVKSEKLRRFPRGDDPAEKGTAQRLDTALGCSDEDRKQNEYVQTPIFEKRYGKKQCQK